jgi:hypothetical protein
MQNNFVKSIAIVITAIILFLSPVNAANDSSKKAIQKKKVDFAITKIYSDKCACDLTGLNVFYANKIIFTIANKSGETEDAEVVLNYNDVALDKDRFVIMKEKSLRPGEERTVVMLDRPVLIRKSIGVTGLAGPVFPAFVEDTNTANNKLIIFDCRLK